MSAPLQLSVVTPEKQLLSLAVDELRAPGAEGSFGVRPGHTPFLTRMDPGELWLRIGTEQQRFAVGDGFIEVEGNRVRVIAETAEPAAAIDVERAQKARADALARMKGLSIESPDFIREQSRLRRAQARIDVAKAR